AFLGTDEYVLGADDGLLRGLDVDDLDQVTLARCQNRPDDLARLGIVENGTCKGIVHFVGTKPGVDVRTLRRILGEENRIVFSRSEAPTNLLELAGDHRGILGSGVLRQAYVVHRVGALASVVLTIFVVELA